MRMTYIMNGKTLTLRKELCNGCGECIEVCPHAVFTMTGRRAEIADRDACMECGACMRNCASGAIKVTAGVGCAAAVINGLLRGAEPTCDCDSSTGRAGKRGCC